MTGPGQMCQTLHEVNLIDQRTPHLIFFLVLTGHIQLFQKGCLVNTE